MDKFPALMVINSEPSRIEVYCLLLALYPNIDPQMVPYWDEFLSDLPHDVVPLRYFGKSRPQQDHSIESFKGRIVDRIFF